MFLLGFYSALLIYVPLRKIAVFKKASFEQTTKFTPKNNPKDWLSSIHHCIETLPCLWYILKESFNYKMRNHHFCVHFKQDFL